MQLIKNNPCFFVLVSVLLLTSCTSATTADKTDKDTAQVVTASDTATVPSYNPALDPLTVAGPNGKLLQDSLGIKIFEVSIKPGEVAALHSHPDHAMYILEGGKAMFYSKDMPGAENGVPAEFKAGEGWVMGPVTDSARNIGKTTIKMLEIDVHRPRGK